MSHPGIKTPSRRSTVRMIGVWVLIFLFSVVASAASAAEPRIIESNDKALKLLVPNVSAIIFLKP